MTVTSSPAVASTIVGIQGPPGNGAPGTTLRDGAGAPSNSVGIDGDYYLNHTTGDLYKRATGTYSIVGNFAGPQGTAGPAGTSTLWRSGSGAPTDSVGNDGDLYFVTGSADLYQRSGGHYGLIANLMGLTGDTGLQGETGNTGAPGNVIRNGVAAPSDSSGIDGDYYLTTTGDLYQRQTGHYTLVMSLKGPTGTPGSVLRNGTSAPVNTVGIDGDYYLLMTTGALYQRQSGLYTAVGNLTGPQGATGTPGTVLRNGNAAPANTTGIDGDYYLVNTTGVLYQRQSGAYASVGNLTGPAGPAFSTTLANVGLTVTQPLDTTIFQRLTSTSGAFGKGQCRPSLTLSALLPVFAIDYRLRDAVATGNPVLQDWTPAAYALPAGTSTIAIAAFPARLGWYYLDIRANGDNSQIVLGTSRIGTGELTLGYGQSLMVDTISAVNADTTTFATLGVTPNQNTSVWGAWNGDTAIHAPAIPADSSRYNSTGSTVYLANLVAAYGVNCGFVGYGQNGAALSLLASGTSHYNNLIALAKAAGGVFGTFMMIQGHGDAVLGTSSAAYKTALGALITAIQSALPTVTFNRVIQSIPADFDSSDGTPSAQAAIRAGSLAYVASDALAVYVDGLDLALYNSVNGSNPANVHPTQAGNITAGREYARAQTALVAGTQANLGPVITGAARANGSATIVLTIAQRGGSALVARYASGGSAADIANQFQVFAQYDTGSPLTIASVIIVSATEIDITLASAPANTQALDLWYRRTPDSNTIIATGIYDNAVYTDGGPGNQLRLQGVAITAAAPTPPTTKDLAMSSPTYTTGKFNQALNGGTGSYASTILTNPGTIECWFNSVTAGAPGAVKVIMGSSPTFYVGCNVDGTLKVQICNSSGTGVSVSVGSHQICDAANHHIAVEFTTTNGYIYLDGVLVGSLGGAAGVTNTTNPIVLRDYGGSVGTYPWIGWIDEVAVFNYQKYASNFTPPAAAYTGGETGLVALWHLDGSGSGVV